MRNIKKSAFRILHSLSQNSLWGYTSVIIVALVSINCTVVVALLSQLCSDSCSGVIDTRAAIAALLTLSIFFASMLQHSQEHLRPFCRYCLSYLEVYVCKHQDYRRLLHT